jgi:Ca2+-binding RTX toxin-like protein
MRRIIVVLAAMAAMVVVYAGAALATSVDEGEPNDSLAQAQNIDNSFSLDFDPNIGNKVTNTSEILPHATVNGTGNDTVDYYSFRVSHAGDGVILDVDGAWVCNEDFTSCDGFTSFLSIYDKSGQTLTSNDLGRPEYGQGGSSNEVDTYLEYTFKTPGTYYVAVSGGGTGKPIPAKGIINGGATSYDLHVSLGTLPFLCENQEPTIEAQQGQPVEGTPGDDIIAGTQGADTINGNGGNDTICGREGNNTINGGDGDDVIDFITSDGTSGRGNNTINGGDGNDSIFGGSGMDSISGGVGNDVMYGGDGNDRINGDQNSDNLYGEGGNDTLDGGLDFDTIDGGEGTDKCSLGDFEFGGCEFALGPNVNP